MNESCACGCGRVLVQTSNRRRYYASDTCRQRAHRGRLAARPVWSGDSQPAIVQVERAILEARSVGFALQRLGVEAPPVLAARCRVVGDTIVRAVTAQFGQV